MAYRVACILLTLGFHVLTAHSQQLVTVTADQIPSGQQTYDFSAISRCRVLAHDSRILKNNDHHILIIDGGFGTFQTQLNGETVSVADLNPYTVAFDLSHDFSTGPGLEPLWQHKKRNNTDQKLSVVNHGGIWVSTDQNTVWTQGGHFYSDKRWTNSSYSVLKDDVPEWRLWRMRLEQRDAGWEDVTDDVAGSSDANRTFAGAAASIPNDNRKFWLGGLLDPKTSPKTSKYWSKTTKQMLVFDESRSSITKQQYYEPESSDGYWQGNLIHLPIGHGSGYLISLMAVNMTTDEESWYIDSENGSSDDGTAVSLQYIPMYDVDRGTWFKQRTSSYGWNGEPKPRTLFCSALFHDTTDNTFELWMHGGQTLSDQGEGIEEIYVLSMPSFIWTKVRTALPQTNLIRSHTCHAVGRQLIIVGGYPTGVDIESNVTCDPEYIKVLDIGENYSFWSNTYRRNSRYRTPLSIRDVVADKRVPDGGFAYEALNTDFQPPPFKRPIGAIVGGVVAGAVMIALVGGLVYCRRWKKKMLTKSGQPDSSPRFGQLEALEDRSPTAVDSFGTSTQVFEVGGRSRAELEASKPFLVQAHETR